MIDKRIEHYQREVARLFELLIREKLLQQQDVIIKAINEHEAVIRELKHIKKLNLGSVSHLFGERYPMCEPQPVQLDCRETECRYHKNAACNNVAPAITIHKGKVTCWTGGSSPNCG